MLAMFDKSLDYYFLFYVLKIKKNNMIQYTHKNTKNSFHLQNKIH
jgi:hypothetical protein